MYLPNYWSSPLTKSSSVDDILLYLPNNWASPLTNGSSVDEIEILLVTARILGFPSNDAASSPPFRFPEETTTAQRYRVLGNSLNVAVVARLMRILFGGEASA